MSFSLDPLLLFEDDADGYENDADDFDIEFDDDFEFISDEEFEVVIEYDEYEANDHEITGDFCLDDDLDGFGDFDSPDGTSAENDFAE